MSKNSENQKRRRRKSLDDKIAAYQEKLNSHICIADEIQLHLNAGLDRLHASDETKEFASNLYARIRGEPFLSYGKKPAIIASAIAYIAGHACNDGRAQKEIGAAFNVSPAGVGKNYQWLKKQVKLSVRWNANTGITVSYGND